MKTTGALGRLARPTLRRPEPVALRIVAEKTFAPGDLENGRALKVHAIAKAPQAMKPEKEVLDVSLTATYGAEGQPDREVVHATPGFVGLALLGGALGDKSIFPPASEEAAGDDHGTDCCEQCHSGRTGAALPLRAFDNPLGCGVSWPTLPEGADARMDFGINKDVLHYCEPPEGYNPTPKRVAIKIEMTMWGATLR